MVRPEEQKEEQQEEQQEEEHQRQKKKKQHRLETPRNKETTLKHFERFWTVFQPSSVQHVLVNAWPPYRNKSSRSIKKSRSVSNSQNLQYKT